VCPGPGHRGHVGGPVAAVLSAALVAVHVVVCVIALGVIPGGRKPSTAMAWLILVLAAPYVGILAFLLFGSTHVERRRHEKQLRVNELIRERTAAAAELTADVPRLAYVAGVARLNRHLGSLPTQADNTVALLPDTRRSLEDMAAVVRTAAKRVSVEFYILGWDDWTAPVFEALAAAAERGVEVRLLFDHLGSRSIPTYRRTMERLAGTKIQVVAMMPIDPLHGRMRRPDLRNHRKILAVDGHTAYTGSQNLIEPGYDKPKNHRDGRGWVDLNARFTGPVVQALEAVFASDWYAETGEVLELGRVGSPEPAGPETVSGVTCQVVPSGPGFATENNLRMFTTLIYSAQRRISLTSPYFVPDESLLYAVTTAAQRGVDVELFVSELSDQFSVGHAQASYYRALLEAGVRIYRYPAPYILHSKHFTVDDDVAVIGSSNMDMRSFALNYEISLMLLGPDVVSRMREVEDRYRAIAKPLTMEEWIKRPARLKYVDNVMRLTAALQ
jgi:cardiolipin synthase A/B